MDGEDENWNKPSSLESGHPEISPSEDKQNESPSEKSLSTPKEGQRNDEETSTEDVRIKNNANTHEYEKLSAEELLSEEDAIPKEQYDSLGFENVSVDKRPSSSEADTHVISLEESVPSTSKEVYSKDQQAIHIFVVINLDFAKMKKSTFLAPKDYMSTENSETGGHAVVELFKEMTGSCACLDKTQRICHVCTPMDTPANVSFNLPMFDAFLELFENEMEPKGRVKDAGKGTEKDSYDHTPHQENSPSDIQETNSSNESNKTLRYSQNAAVDIMEKVISSSKLQIWSQKQSYSLDDDKLDYLAEKVKEFEKSLKSIDVKKHESQREIKILQEQIQNLETRALAIQKTEVINRIMNAEVPSQTDIEALGWLQEIIKNQEECKKVMKELEMENRVKERLKENVKGILLSSSPWLQAALGDQLLKNGKTPPKKEKKIRFDEAVSVFYFDKREPASKVPHHKSELVLEMDIEFEPPSTEYLSVHLGEAYLEEKMEEQRKKKEEEKYVKITDLSDEEDEDEEEQQTTQPEG